MPEESVAEPVDSHQPSSEPESAELEEYSAVQLGEQLEKASKELAAH
jgi:hypothetical protein